LSVSAFSDDPKQILIYIKIVAVFSDCANEIEFAAAVMFVYVLKTF
jgi:hypothetical protein